MSGHNKWTQIKHRKGAADAKRSKVFSMLSRQITLDARQANGDKNHPALRKAVERARVANMPNDNIERAISKATGANAETFEAVMYEAYGPGGVAMIVTGITDNNNRTSQEVRHLLSANGGNLATPGAAIWAFNKVEGESGATWQAQAPISLSDQDADKLRNLVETLSEHDDIQHIFTNAESN